MKKQMTWERRETSNLRHYCVVGERLLDDRDDGWFVSSWSDSVPIIGYWVEGGRFYQADTDWVTGTTMDLEINREIALDPERERITLEAIDGWRPFRRTHLRAGHSGETSVPSGCRIAMGGPSRSTGRSSRIVREEGELVCGGIPGRTLSWKL